MFRALPRIWLILAAVFCVAALGGVYAFWPKPKPITFLDFPTRELHATCHIHGLTYDQPDFLTSPQIDELRKIVRESRPIRPDDGAKGPVYIVHDLTIHFFHHEERIDHYVFSGMDWVYQFNTDQSASWRRINRDDYSQFLFHCHETYQKRHPEIDEEAP